MTISNEQFHEVAKIVTVHYCDTILAMIEQQKALANDGALTLFLIPIIKEIENLRAQAEGFGKTPEDTNQN